MNITDRLIAEVTKAVLDELMRERDYAEIGTNPHEIVIGVAPAFGDKIRHTLNKLEHNEILREIRAGIEEEGMLHRTVKVYKTSDVAFVGKEAARLSGSGISIGLQSKGTAIIHQRDLNPLSNLELFAQAPLLTLSHYRKLGRNAAKYAKGENVTPVKVENDPVTRAAYQVKAALMHIKETELIDKNIGTINWTGA